MRISPTASLLFLNLFFSGYSFALEQFQTEQDAQKHCPSDTVVWLNTASGNLHRKGQPWYGLTSKGAYVCKNEVAAKDSHKPEARAATGWVVVSRMNMSGGSATLYADLATIRNNGGIANMWSLIDFESEQEIEEIKFFSSKLNKEYDCKKGRWRIFSSSVFNKHMGEGQTVQSDNDPDEWRPVEPESPAKEEWKIACGKK